MNEEYFKNKNKKDNFMKMFKKIAMCSAILSTFVAGKTASAVEVNPFAESVVTSNSKMNGETIKYGIGYGLKADLGNNFGMSVSRNSGRATFESFEYTPSSYTAEVAGTPSSFVEGSYVASSYTPEATHDIHVIEIGKHVIEIGKHGIKTEKLEVVDVASSYTPSEYTPSEYIPEVAGTQSKYTPEQVKKSKSTHDFDVYRVMGTYSVDLAKGVRYTVGLGENFVRMDGQDGNAFVMSHGVDVKHNVSKNMCLTGSVMYMYNEPIRSMNMDFGDTVVAQVGVSMIL